MGHGPFLLSVTNPKDTACHDASQPGCCRTVQGEPFGEESDKAKCDAWEHQFGTASHMNFLQLATFSTRYVYDSSAESTVSFTSTVPPENTIAHSVESLSKP
jgi:hypothetical protein